jgi:hypothetical protein
MWRSALPRTVCASVRYGHGANRALRPIRTGFPSSLSGGSVTTAHGINEQGNEMALSRFLRTLIFLASTCGIADTATAAESLKIKGFYIGMTEADARAAVQSDITTSGGNRPSSINPLPRGGDVEIQLHKGFEFAGYLLFQQNWLIAISLHCFYFDACSLEGTAFIKAVLKNYPIKNAHCQPNGCKAVGPAGEEVNINADNSVLVMAPLPTPEPSKPSFN